MKQQIEQLIEKYERSAIGCTEIIDKINSTEGFLLQDTHIAQRDRAFIKRGDYRDFITELTKILNDGK